jgi:septal ring factor EnvC (AmiA/AmiB activator)
MAKKFALPLLAFAFLALTPAAQAQTQSPGDIVIKAPSNLTVQNEREWTKLKRDYEKLNKQIVDREKRVARERANAAKQQKRVADAQKRLSREQSRLQGNERNLSREMSRLQSDVQDRAKVQGRMIEMGGERAVQSSQPR